MEYVLTQNGARATLDSEGGMMTGYTLPDGAPCLWTRNAAYWASCAPLLFPVVGALRDDTLRIDGYAYPMPKHGFARKKQFRAEHIGASSARFVLESDADTRCAYPFAFRVTTEHTLLDNGFTTSVTVSNPGSEPLHFCVGGHPGFCCPKAPGEAFEDYELLFSEQEDPEALYTDAAGILHPENRRTVLRDNRLALNYALFDDDVLIFRELRSRRVTLRNRNTGRGVALSFEGFSSLGVWTPPQKRAPFVCLEPWQGLPAFAQETGELAEKPGAVELPGGVSYRCAYTVEVL